MTAAAVEVQQDLADLLTDLRHMTDECNTLAAGGRIDPIERGMWADLTWSMTYNALSIGGLGEHTTQYANLLTRAKTDEDHAAAVKAALGTRDNLRALGGAR